MLKAESKTGTRKLKRRWLQFSLRSLLIFVLLWAVLLGVWTGYVGRYWRQKQAIVKLENMGGEFGFKPADDHQWIAWIVGKEDFRKVRSLCLQCEIPPEQLPEFERAVGDLLGLESLLVNATAFSDESLSRLRPPKEVWLISLEGTTVRGPGLKHLAAWPSLRRLALYDTPVTDEAMVDIGRMKQLIDLSLGHTRVTDRGLTHLEELTDLGCLNLGGLDVTDAGLVHLKGMTQLYDLCFEGTKVTDDGLEQLSHLRQLQQLDLSNTQITGEGLKYLQASQGLFRLKLTSTPTDDTGLAELTRFKGLESLDLSATRVTDQGMAEVNRMSRLRVLTLWGTKLTDTGLAYLDKMPLTHLDVRQTSITPAGLDRLRQRRPGLYIWSDY